MDADILEIRKKRAFEAGFILYGLFWFLLSFVTNTNLLIMFFSTLSVLAGMILLVALIESDFFNMTAVSLIPLILALLFYAVWRSNTFAAFSRTDGPVLAVVNLIVTYIIYIIVFFIWGNERKNKTKVSKAKTDTNNNKDTKYNQLLGMLNSAEEKNKKDIQEFKKTIEDYSEKIKLSNQEKEYYKDIASNYYACSRENEINQNKLEQVSANYAENIRKYVAELMNQVKKLSLDARTEKLDPRQYAKSKKFYEKRIDQLNKRIKEAELALKVTEDNFKVNLRSIEDKCKAINFVIGRVYSDKHGGSKEIRKLLNINRVLYNAFSKITSDFDSKNLAYLTLILNILQKKLSLYHLSENKLFKLKKKSSLKRDADGNDIVLNVLAWNDQDPIKEYHSEANEICLNMIEFINRNYSK